MRTTFFVLTALALPICGCGGAETPATEPAPDPAPAPAPAPAPSVAWLEGLAAGAREHVDPARGVIFVRYTSDASGEDPDADAEGLVRTAERLCGDALEPRLARLGDDLRMRLEDEAWRDLIACEADTCTMPAMGEYDLTGDLTFTDGALDTVVRIEGGPVTDDFRQAGRAWADTELARLAATPCVSQ